VPGPRGVFVGGGSVADDLPICLFDATRGVYISASGEASPFPTFLRASQWRGIALRNLESGTRHVLRARARGASGALSSFGPALELRPKESHRPATPDAP